MWGTIYLAAIGLIGWFGAINWLNRQADSTTAFNLAAVVACAVALAPRVFAACFLLQALVAAMLARRKQTWGAVAGFAAVGLAMATISSLGISI